jgi:hypothetical protein
MSATYSSFDTLTIGQFEGPLGFGGSDLPVLAEIPMLGAEARPSVAAPREPAPQVAERAHLSPPPPRFGATSPTPIHSAPGDSAATRIDPARRPPEPAPTHSAGPYETKPFESKIDREAPFEETGWATALLDLETTLRPHARLIVLVALIAVTSLTLLLMRAPVTEAPQAPPTDVVDAPPLAPPFEGSLYEAPINPEPAPQTQFAERERLAPISAMPEPMRPATATITAVGPPGMPPIEAQASPERGPVFTPVLPYKDSGTQATRSLESSAVATAAGPTAPQTPAYQTTSPTAVVPTTTPEVRVAERVAYPATSYPQQSWNPAAAPPRAELMPPVSPYQSR